ncbi:hypothetical protein BDV93DRAFT_340521, partial [Ceratobasidium sp. AG-I]
ITLSGVTVPTLTWWFAPSCILLNATPLTVRRPQFELAMQRKRWFLSTGSSHTGW